MASEKNRRCYYEQRMNLICKLSSVKQFAGTELAKRRTFSARCWDIEAEQRSHVPW